MSRTGSPTDFEQDAIYLFFAVNFQLDDGIVGFWTGFGDITISGDTYVGAGELLSFSPIEEDSSIKANGVSVILAGLDSDSADLALDTDYQYRPAEIIVGTLTASGAVNQHYILFRGRIDQIAIDDGPETSTVIINLESRLIELNRPRTLHYTDEEQRNLSPIRGANPSVTGYPSTLIAFAADRGLASVVTIQDKQIVWKT
jgi:hypothetical protein